jgi:hypothetical protein
VVIFGLILYPTFTFSPGLLVPVLLGLDVVPICFLSEELDKETVDNRDDDREALRALCCVFVLNLFPED